jgi:DNA topoisomerase-3
LNTVELLKIASKNMGISPGHTMSIAERLYINGYISYPRTESTAYPASFDFLTLLKTLSTSTETYDDVINQFLTILTVDLTPNN